MSYCVSGSVSKPKGDPCESLLQINSKFIGLRPAGRTRDYTWIQAIGVLFGSKTFSLEAKHAATWDEEFDHLKFSYNGKDIFVPESHLSSWKSPESNLTVERTSDKNSVLVTLPDIAEFSAGFHEPCKARRCSADSQRQMPDLFTSRCGLLFLYILYNCGPKGFIADGLWDSRLQRCSLSGSGIVSGNFKL